MPNKDIGKKELLKRKELVEKMAKKFGVPPEVMTERLIDLKLIEG